MNSLKKVLHVAIITVFLSSAAFLTGCGGLTEAQLAELDALRKEVSALEKEANSLKDERARLEKDIADKNAKLQECVKMKEETKANLEKLSK